MPGIARAKRTIGRRIGSDALVCDGACSWVCAWTAWSVLLGLGLQVLLGWWWLDSATTVVPAIWVERKGCNAWREAGQAAIPRGGVARTRRRDFRRV